MDQFSLLADGLANALTPINLRWVLIGAVLGTAVGVLPGLGSSMAVGGGPQGFPFLFPFPGSA